MQAPLHAKQAYWPPHMPHQRMCEWKATAGVLQLNIEMQVQANCSNPLAGLKGAEERPSMLCKVSKPCTHKRLTNQAQGSRVIITCWLQENIGPDNSPEEHAGGKTDMYLEKEHTAVLHARHRLCMVDSRAPADNADSNASTPSQHSMLSQLDQV
jgi:hypothetical protein